MLKAELTGLEADLGHHRDAVTKVKLQRDQLRQENSKLKASRVNSQRVVVFTYVVVVCDPSLTFSFYRPKAVWLATSFSFEISIAASGKSRAWKYA